MFYKSIRRRGGCVSPLSQLNMLCWSGVVVGCCTEPMFTSIVAHLCQGQSKAAVDVCRSVGGFRKKDWRSIKIIIWLTQNVELLLLYFEVVRAKHPMCLYLENRQFPQNTGIPLIYLCKDLNEYVAQFVCLLWFLLLVALLVLYLCKNTSTNWMGG